MSPLVLQDVAHQLRTATHVAAVTINEMSGATPAQLEMLRKDLRNYTLMVMEVADRLHPICSTAVAELPACLVRAGMGL